MESEIPKITPLQGPGAAEKHDSRLGGEAVDDDRHVLGTIIPGSQGERLTRSAQQLLRVSNAMGRFTASRMLLTPNVRESELLHHRAKVAFVDSAALTVPMFFDELSRKKPCKVRLDGCLAAMRGAGIVVDSVPLSKKDRDDEMTEDRAAAAMSNQELMARQAERLRRLNGGKEE